MKEKREKEETKAEEQDLVTSPPSFLPGEPYTWLMITDGKSGSERHIFYSITEDYYYVRSVSELQNKHVIACCFGRWLVLSDNSTNDYSILNILTMEKLHLPSLPIHPDPEHKSHIKCVISSPKMDRSCRVIFFERKLRKFWSCHLGDSEYIEREQMYRDEEFSDLINFKGKLYALTSSDFNLVTSDFSDPDLHYELVISVESLRNYIFIGHEYHFHLVESCEDLLLIFICSYDFEVSDVIIFKADFNIGEWVKLETLGDRAIFLDSLNNNFSSPAKAVGMKGNAVYWVRSRTCCDYPPRERHLYMYDVEEKSISMSLPCPIAETNSSLSWVLLPMTCIEEKKPEQKNGSYLFEINSQVRRGKSRTEYAKLQPEQRKSLERELTETIGCTVVNKESLWADLPNDILEEITRYLIAGDKVAFHSVCKSWHSVSPSKITQQFVLPLNCSDHFSPFLVCSHKQNYHPFYGNLYSINFSDYPGTKVRAARDGWLLLDYSSSELFFYNPSTNEEIVLPGCNAQFYYSVYFSAPPTSADCLIVVAVWRWDHTQAVCYKKSEDEGWTSREISLEKYSYEFSSCNAVVYKGLYYFLGYAADLLIYDPEKDKVRVVKAPECIYKLKVKCGLQYMLECDGKLLAVFVSKDGSSVYTCRWNNSKSKWNILGSLGNIKLFVSRPLSVWKKVTIRGTGNKIYFPRVVGDGHLLFYSLATKRYHTFEKGTSFLNFLRSKYYTEYSYLFMP